MYVHQNELRMHEICLVNGTLVVGEQDQIFKGTVSRRQVGDLIQIRLHGIKATRMLSFRGGIGPAKAQRYTVQSSGCLEIFGIFRKRSNLLK